MVFPVPSAAFRKAPKVFATWLAFRRRLTVSRPLDLLPLRRFVDLQHLNGLLVVFGELVHAHDHLLALLDFALVFVAGLGDLGLRESALDGRDHARPCRRCAGCSRFAAASTSSVRRSTK